MSMTTIFIFSVIIPLIIYYRVNYNKLRILMMSSNMNFTGNIYNLKDIFIIFKALKSRVINNNTERFFLITMLLCLTLSFILLMIYWALLFFSPDILFFD